MESSGRNADGTFGKGNRAAVGVGGQPKWVRDARADLREGLYSLAARHIRWVLSGVTPRDATEAEKDMYANVSVDDRTTAAKLVVEYSLPKPKQAVAAKVEGELGGLVVQVVTQPKEES